MTTRPRTAAQARHFEVADEEAAPITFDYKGETYRCRGATPALPVLRGMRALIGGLNDDAAMKIGMDLMEAVFEAGELERILATGISVERLTRIVERVLAIYNGEPPAGESAPPATGADSSAASSTTST